MPARVAPLVRAACFMAALAVAAVILYESTQERGRPGVPDLSTNEAYAGHFVIYALMTFWALGALVPRLLPVLAAVLLLAAGFGVALELYQLQVPTRTSSAGDAFADAAGAICGLALYLGLGAMPEPQGRRQTTKP